MPGFSGVVAFREDPSLPLAAFQLEWADGRADFDPAAAADRIGDGPDLRPGLRSRARRIPHPRK